MTTLTVWKFNTAEGAQETLAKLVPLQKEHIIDIKDAATVSWPGVSEKGVGGVGGVGSVGVIFRILSR